ncbi:MAG: hypothetical protein ACT4QD_05690 [Acidobacteriota bacterium]
MIRTVLLVFVLAAGVAAAANADVTIKMTTSGKGLGMAGSSAGTTYIKGTKMRTDAQIGDRVMTSIFDLDAQKMFSFDSRRKEADVWDMAAMGAEIAKSVDTSGMKASITANGKTKAFGAHSATGYDMEITVPAAMGGSKDMQMMVTLAGPVWIVKGAPGSADYNNFYKSAVEKGWIFGDPRAAKGSPGQAKAMAEMYRQFAALGGIAYETDIQIKMGMSGAEAGPMGGLLARMGNISATTVVESVETSALSDDLFAPPAGYKLNNRR